MAKNVVKHSLVQFTMVGNICLRNVNISNGAKGLYATLWDLPDDWELTYHGLAKKCKDGMSAIKTQMHELLSEGYVVVTQQRGENGRMGVNVWNVLNIPAPLEERTPAKTRKKRSKTSGETEGRVAPLTEKPLTDFPLTEKPLTVNRTQHNKENKEILEEGRSLKPSSTKKQTKVEVLEKENVEALRERYYEAFKWRWNKAWSESKDSQTCEFSRITPKRKRLMDDIFCMLVTEDGEIDWHLIEIGCKNAMVSKRAQGLVKGMTSKADLDYMLENFVKLVEGTF